MTWGRNTRKRVFTERCACGRALGSHLQRASARRYTSGVRRPGQRERCSVSGCVGAIVWGSYAIVLKCSFAVSTYFPTGTNLALSKLWFSKWLETCICVISIFRKMIFCELKGLQAWSTVHMDLDKACKVGTMS